MGLENFTTEEDEDDRLINQHKYKMENLHESESEFIHEIVMALKEQRECKWIRFKQIEELCSYEKRLVGYGLSEYNIAERWSGKTTDNPVYHNPFFQY